MNRLTRALASLCTMTTLACGSFGGVDIVMSLQGSGKTVAEAGRSMRTMEVHAGDGGEAPRLRFGVVSDVHIGGRKTTAKRLDTTLKWLAAQNVDAVLFCGDITHSGLIGEIERFASIWCDAFPENRAADGRTVKLLLVTGNHDAEASWVKGTDEWRTRNVLAHGDNFARVWKRLFDEPWELVWKREVKGYSFVGAQWSSLNPPIERFVAEHKGELSSGKPFFFCQHAHPKGTCHDGFADVRDSGVVVRALRNFPNAVAFTGHSHCTLADERAVWQGTFTSIGAGCLHEGGAPFSYANISAFWWPPSYKNLMASLNDPDEWGGDPDGGCFEMVDVLDGCLRIARRSSVYDLPVGPDWIVPLPSKEKGPLDFAARARKRSAPQFAADAVLKVETCLNGHPMESHRRGGEPCVYLGFPCARSVDGCRVFDYVVTATTGGRTVKRLELFAPGAMVPEAKADRPGECLLSLAELPKDVPITFSVMPRECFGKTGKALTASWANKRNEFPTTSKGVGR